MNKGRNDFAERPRACTLRVVRFPSPSRILLCRVNVTRVCELLVLLCARVVRDSTGWDRGSREPCIREEASHVGI